MKKKFTASEKLQGLLDMGAEMVDANLVSEVLTELAQLRAERDNLNVLSSDLVDTAQKYYAERNALESLLKRAREALLHLSPQTENNQPCWCREYDYEHLPVGKHSEDCERVRSFLRDLDLNSK